MTAEQTAKWQKDRQQVVAELDRAEAQRRGPGTAAPGASRPAPTAEQIAALAKAAGSTSAELDGLAKRLQGMSDEEFAANLKQGAWRDGSPKAALIDAMFAADGARRAAAQPGPAGGAGADIAALAKAAGASPAEVDALAQRVHGMSAEEFAANVKAAPWRDGTPKGALIDAVVAREAAGRAAAGNGAAQSAPAAAGADVAALAKAAGASPAEVDALAQRLHGMSAEEFAATAKAAPWRDGTPKAALIDAIVANEAAGRAAAAAGKGAAPSAPAAGADIAALANAAHVPPAEVEEIAKRIRARTPEEFAKDLKETPWRNGTPNAALIDALVAKEVARRQAEAAGARPPAAPAAAPVPAAPAAAPVPAAPAAAPVPAAPAAAPVPAAPAAAPAAARGAAGQPPPPLVLRQRPPLPPRARRCRPQRWPRRAPKSPPPPPPRSHACSSRGDAPQNRFVAA